jgi:hypothetical protein
MFFSSNNSEDTDGLLPVRAYFKLCPQGKVENTLSLAQALQVKLAYSEPHTERQSKELRVVQMSTLKGMFETRIEPVFPQAWGDLDAQLFGCGINVFHVTARLAVALF